MIIPQANNNYWQIAGAATAAFSLLMGLLVLFVIPGACSFLGGLQLVLLAFLFLGGLVVFAAAGLWPNFFKKLIR